MLDNQIFHTRRDFLKNSTILLGACSMFGTSLFADSKNPNIPNITLNNGVKMPHFGYGTWQIKGEKGIESMLEAFKVGYRLIDSASYYQNEAEVGEAFRQSKLKREEVFITTKISTESDTRKALESSLAKMKLDFVDLYLIHWSTGANLSRYKAFESLYKEGKARAIGVSNFSIKDLENLAKETSIVPAVNQIELHPFYVDSSVIEYCKAKNIAVEAYTPLGNIKNAMKNEILQSIAKKHKKSVAQVMLKWSVQSGFIPIPRSSNANRIKENISIFDFSLDETDMQEIATLNSKSGSVRGW